MCDLIWQYMKHMCASLYPYNWLRIFPHPLGLWMINVIKCVHVILVLLMFNDVHAVMIFRHRDISSFWHKNGEMPDLHPSAVGSSIEMQHSGESGCFVSRASWCRLKSTLSSALDNRSGNMPRKIMEANEAKIEANRSNGILGIQLDSHFKAPWCIHDKEKEELPQIEPSCKNEICFWRVFGVSSAHGIH